jgi:hypothetical protein
MPRLKYAYILLAVLAAGLAGLFLVYRLAGRANPSGEKGASPPRAVESAPSEKAGPDTEGAFPSEPAEESKPGNYSFVSGLLKSSGMNPVFGSFQLNGTLVNEADPGSSSASIEDLGTGSHRIYLLNAMLPDDSRLATIGRDYVVLQKNGVRKRIYLATRRSRSGISEYTSRGFRKIGDGEYNLNPYKVFRGDADSVLDFTLSTAKAASGEKDGIRVSGIGSDSLARTLGLEENDVLTEVNGEPVDGTIKSIYACIRAYHSDELQLKIRRGDKDVSLTYHLFWEGKGSWTPMDVLRSKAVASLFKNGFAGSLF